MQQDRLFHYCPPRYQGPCPLVNIANPCLRVRPLRLSCSPPEVWINWGATKSKVSHEQGGKLRVALPQSIIETLQKSKTKFRPTELSSGIWSSYYGSKCGFSDNTVVSKLSQVFIYLQLDHSTWLFPSGSIKNSVILILRVSLSSSGGLCFTKKKNGS